MARTVEPSGAAGWKGYYINTICCNHRKVKNGAECVHVHPNNMCRVNVQCITKWCSLMWVIFCHSILHDFRHNSRVDRVNVFKPCSLKESRQFPDSWITGKRTVIVWWRQAKSSNFETLKTGLKCGCLAAKKAKQLDQTQNLFTKSYVSLLALLGATVSGYYFDRTIVAFYQIGICSILLTA